MPSYNDLKICVAAIGGLPGAGKSAVASALRKTFEYPRSRIISSDRLRKELWKELHPDFNVWDPLPPENMKPEFLDFLASRFISGARSIVEQGHTAIVYSGFSTERMPLLLAEGVKPFPVEGFWLHADHETLMRRVELRTLKRNTHATTNPEMLKEIFGRNAQKPNGWMEISTQNCTPEDVAQTILNSLRCEA